MNSCLYEGTVFHYRKKPKTHRLEHRVFMFYLDLDEIDGLCRKNCLLGHNRFRLYSFYDKDHMPLSHGSVRENITEFLRAKGETAQVGRIMVLANLRTLGYVFNPLTLFYCFDALGRPLCVVPQIGNTFGEIKAFLLDQDTLADGAFKSRQQKLYYISPFSDLDIQLDFQLKLPAERLDVRVDDVQNGEKFLYASLTGKRKELNIRNLLWLTVKYPLITLKVISLIHIHALILFFKGIPYHLKESDPHLQKEVIRARG